MSKEYTKNHIVPNRYLKRFGFDKNGKRVIGTRYVDENGVKLFVKNTDDVGYIKNFNNSELNEDPKFWEKFFNIEFDYLYGTELETIISVVNLSVANSIVLNAHSKDVLSRIIMSQILRVPSSVDKIFDINSKMKNEISDELKQEIQKKYPEDVFVVAPDIEFSDNALKDIFFSTVFSNKVFKGYLEILKTGIWVVYYNQNSKGIPFVTSDNPVLVEGFGKNKTGIYNNPLKNPDTCIFFPITPAIAVVIYAKDGFFSIRRDDYDGKKILLNDDKFIVFRNYNIMEQADQHSFIPQPLFNNLYKEYLEEKNKKKGSYHGTE